MRIAAGLTLLAAAFAALTVAGCSNGFWGRYITLQTPDIEDYRHLPVRTVTASTSATPLTQARDPEWPARVQPQWGGATFASGAALDAFLRAKDTTAFIILQNGAVVDERYYNGYSRTQPSKSFSMSKSVLSALIGIAESEGALKISDPVGAYIPGLRDQDLAQVTLEQLLDTVAGLAYQRGYAPWDDQARMYYTNDMRAFVLDAKLEAPPGQKFSQEDLSPQLLAVALEKALRRAGKAQTISEYTSSRLWVPMGAEANAVWVLDREGDGIEKSESGFVARAIDLARFGQLFLDGGQAHGRQIVPGGWVEASVTPPAKGSPNLFVEGFHRKLWWGAFRPSRTRNDFYANGHFGQRIYVSPDKRLVIVRLGSDSADVDWTEFLGSIADAWK
jgi:CubicO group peptidase (beta-lactamase class C family)